MEQKERQEARGRTEEQGQNVCKCENSGEERSEENGSAKTGRVSTFVFLSMLFLCFLFAVSTLFSTATISERENRKLETFPTLTWKSYLNGSFFKGAEAYMYDHFPQRDLILQWSAWYDTLKGRKPDMFALKHADLVRHADDEKESSGGGSRPPGRSVNAENRKGFEKYKRQTENLSLIADGDRIVSMFLFREDVLERYIDVLREFVRRFAESERDIHVYSLLVPTNSGLTDEKYAAFTDPQDLAISYVYERAGDGVIAVDVFSELYRHKDEYLYFRSDHHWTSLGAYYAAKAFAEVAQVECSDIGEYTLHSFDGFLGYLYHNNPVEQVAARPERLDAYVKPGKSHEVTHFYKKDGKTKSFKQPLVDVSGKVSYGIFLGGDYAISVVENPNAGTGRSLMMVKDSFGNAFIPWLADSFDRIVAVDPRAFDEDIFVLAKRYEVTDFLILNYINTTVLDGFVRFLEAML